MYITKENAVIGSGATYCMYSDRKACTIIAKTKNTLTLQKDKAELLTKPEFIIGGFSAHCTNNNNMEYKYSPDKDGIIEKAYWSEKQKRFLVNKYYSVIEGRHEFYDYNF